MLAIANRSWQAPTIRLLSGPLGQTWLIFSYLNSRYHWPSFSELQFLSGFPFRQMPRMTLSLELNGICWHTVKHSDILMVTYTESCKLSYSEAGHFKEIYLSIKASGF